MLAQVNAHRAERLQVKLLHVLRRRLQDHLQLVVLVKPVGILAIAAIGGPARRLHVGYLVGLWPKHTQKSFRRHGAGADIDVVGLLQDTSSLGPEGLEAEDEFLESRRIGLRWIHSAKLLALSH